MNRKPSEARGTAACVVGWRNPARWNNARPIENHEDIKPYKDNLQEILDSTRVLCWMGPATLWHTSWKVLWDLWSLSPPRPSQSQRSLPWKGTTMARAGGQAKLPALNDFIIFYITVLYNCIHEVHCPVSHFHSQCFILSAISLGSALQSQQSRGPLVHVP